MKYGGHILLLQDDDCIIIVLPYGFMKDKDKVNLEENVNEGVTLLYFHFVQSAKDRKKTSHVARQLAPRCQINHK